MIVLVMIGTELATGDLNKSRAEVLVHDFHLSTRFVSSQISTHIGWSDLIARTAGSHETGY